MLMKTNKLMKDIGEIVDWLMQVEGRRSPDYVQYKSTRHSLATVWLFMYMFIAQRILAPETDQINLAGLKRHVC